MKITTEQAHGGVIIRLRGALEGHYGDNLAEEIRGLLQQGYRRFVLDFYKVGFINSTGVGHLVRTFTIANTVGGSIMLYRLNEKLTRVLTVTKILASPELTIADSQRDVDAFLQSAPTDPTGGAPTE